MHITRKREILCLPSYHFKAWFIYCPKGVLWMGMLSRLISDCFSKLVVHYGGSSGGCLVVARDEMQNQSLRNVCYRCDGYLQADGTSSEDEV